MKQSGNNVNIAFALYLLILLIILVSWREIDIAPPIYQRLLFVIASTMPSILFYQKTLLPIIACFSTISFYGYAHTYFPAELMFVLPMLIAVAPLKRKRTARKNGSALLLILAFYTAIVDLLTSGVVQPVSLSFLSIFVFEALLDNDEESFRLYSYSLCLSSIALSIEFFFVGEEMVSEYASLGLSRVYLRDPNYYGAIIGAGAVIAFRELLRKKEDAIVEKVFYATTVALTFVTVVLNASRGAMLSLSSCFVFLLMLQPSKTKYKVLLLLLSVIGVYLLYKNGFFELLQYRIESDSGTGSNRTVIWTSKMRAFLDESSIINVFFGHGNSRALKMGINAAFHNDFIAMLVEYGILGLTLLIFLVLRPIFYSKPSSRISVFVLVLFLVLTCSTIEPITSGRYSHLFFYVYIVKLVFLNKEPMPFAQDRMPLEQFGKN